MELPPKTPLNNGHNFCGILLGHTKPPSIKSHLYLYLSVLIANEFFTMRASCTTHVMS
jgi:hypothetical protein